MLMQTAPDDKSRRYLVTNAIECYKKAAELDTANTEYKIRLAGAIMEEGSQPMQGVMLLLGIVQKDSNNVDAQLMLGRFGLISGQIDKAIARFQKILYLQPQNTEALFMLAQAYDTQGNKEKALELLEKCKKSTTDPKVRKEIDNVIENLKKPKS
jgi:cytochrome c-type biogenesis protein CcmH/NrfG